MKSWQSCKCNLYKEYTCKIDSSAHHSVSWLTALVCLPCCGPVNNGLLCDRKSTSSCRNSRRGPPLSNTTSLMPTSSVNLMHCGCCALNVDRRNVRRAPSQVCTADISPSDTWCRNKFLTDSFPLSVHFFSLPYYTSSLISFHCHHCLMLLADECLLVYHQLVEMNTLVLRLLMNYHFHLPQHSLTLSFAFNHCMALNSLLCADVPLRTYTLTHASALTSSCWSRTMSLRLFPANSAILPWSAAKKTLQTLASERNHMLGIYLPPKHVLRCIERQARFHGVLRRGEEGTKKINNATAVTFSPLPPPHTRKPV